MLNTVLRRVRRLDRLAWVLVVAPTLLAALYFGLAASAVYVSESRFVVRSPERKVASPLGAVLAGVGFSKAQDDSFSVRDYILSRDALQVLNQRIGLGKAYASPEVDRLNRFAGLDPDDSFEALDRFWHEAVPADRQAVDAFLAQLKNLTQMPASVYANADEPLRWPAPLL